MLGPFTFFSRGPLLTPDVLPPDTCWLLVGSPDQASLKAFFNLRRRSERSSPEVVLLPPPPLVSAPLLERVLVVA